jgi:hypothetical protein
VADLSAENGSSGSNDSNSSHQSTKLITFLGKGGSGKTTSAVFAAQVHGHILHRCFEFCGFCYLFLVIICGFLS